MDPWFKNRYQKYANVYKNRIIKKVNKHKAKIHTVLEPYLDEQNISNIITDYLPYISVNKKYLFEKVNTWNYRTFYHKKLTNYTDIIGILILFLKGEKYLNKKELSKYIQSITYMFDEVYLYEDGIHLFYTLCYDLMFHSSFRLPVQCETIQDFQVALKFVDTRHSIFSYYSEWIDNRIDENLSLRHSPLQLLSVKYDIYTQEYFAQTCN